MATTVSAAPGAVLTAIVSYTPAGSTSQILAQDSVVTNTGGADAALSLSFDVAPCVRSASDGVCVLTLTVRLTRNGVLLDESVQRLNVDAQTQRVTANPVQLNEVTNVSISTTPATQAALNDFQPGDQVTLTAVAKDRTGAVVANRSPLWSVVSGGVTAAQTGVVQAVTQGAAVVRATVGTAIADLPVTVKPSSVDSLVFTPADTAVGVATIFTPRLVVKARNGDVLTGRAVTFSSSNTNVATVNASGQVTTGALGTATITARSTDGRGGTVVTGTLIVRVQPAPIFAVTPSAMSFQTELGQPLPAAVPVAVSNSGGLSLGTLSVVLSSDSLITATLDRTTAPATLTVQPSLRATSVPAVGVPTISTARVRSSITGVADGVVTVTITRRPSPQIVLDRTTVAFDSVPSNTTSASVVVNVTSPTRALNGVLVTTTYLQNVTPWLTATLGATTTPTTVTLRASAGALPVGTYSADVVVSSTDPSQSATVRVTMRIPPPPSVILAPRTLNFGPLDPAQLSGPALLVSVSSTPTNFSGLNTAISYITGTNWLTAQLSSSNAPTSLLLTPHPNGLAEGSYQARVVVASSVGSPKPDTVIANLTVRIDSIVYNPDSVSYTLSTGQAGTLQSVSARTRSGDTLSLDASAVSIVYDQPQFTTWLGSPTVLTSLLPTTLRFTPNATTLPLGTYSARIFLRARNGTRLGALKVSLNVPGFTQIAGGYTHVCGVNSLNALYCWGMNNYGQLGNGLTNSALVPTRSAQTLTVAQVAVGFDTGCARTTTGTVSCWGYNFYGTLGRGTIDPSGTTPFPTPQPVSGGRTFVDLKGGGYHMCGLTSTGAVYCWGDDEFGQIGDGGGSPATVPTLVTGAPAFAQIAVGAFHTCGRTAAGAAWCWGNNEFGAIGSGNGSGAYVPTQVVGGLSFTNLFAGGNNTCGIVSNGDLYCWGSNTSGSLGIGDFAAADATSPRLVAGGLKWSTVSMSELNICALTSAGKPYCWGDNESYTLGNGTQTPASSPTPVFGSLTATSITSGAYFSCVRTNTGAAYCWGDGTDGQMGNGFAGFATTPTLVSPPQGFVQSSLNAFRSSVNPLLPTSTPMRPMPHAKRRR